MTKIGVSRESDWLVLVVACMVLRNIQDQKQKYSLEWLKAFNYSSSTTLRESTILKS